MKFRVKVRETVIRVYEVEAESPARASRPDVYLRADGELLDDAEPTRQVVEVKEIK